MTVAMTAARMTAVAVEATIAVAAVEVLTEATIVVGVVIVVGGATKEADMAMTAEAVAVTVAVTVVVAHVNNLEIIDGKMMPLPNPIKKTVPQPEMNARKETFLETSTKKRRALTSKSTTIFRLNPQLRTAKFLNRFKPSMISVKR